MGHYSKIIKSKKKKQRTLLPETLHMFLARRIIDGSALTLLLSGAFILLSIMSYSHTDPSWNTASATTSAPIHNILRTPGAYVSDFLIQTLGLGGAVFGAIFLIWGFKLWRRIQISSFHIRIITLLCAVMFTSICMARIPAQAWTPHAYLGGSGGALILNAIAGITQSLIGTYAHTIVAVISAFIATAFFIHASAIKRETMIKAALNLFAVARFAVLLSAHCVSSFFGWLSHYGDPDYQTKAAPKIKLKEPKASTATEKTDKNSVIQGIMPQPKDDAAPEKKVGKSKIKVVAPEAGRDTQVSNISKQKNWNNWNNNRAKA